MDRTMDAAARAELDVLRRRAYGPAADIAEDGPALERLIALEELARPAPADVSPEQVGDADPAPAPGDAGPSDARVVEVLAAPPRRRRPRWHLALVAAVAALTVPLGVIAAQRALWESEAPARAQNEIVGEARAFTTDPASKLLMSVRTDGYFGDQVDVATSADVPVFPAENPMTWAAPLGEYFGWKLWIGGARGAVDDENCLLLDGVSGVTFSACMADDLKERGALLVSVPFDDVDPDERPEGMTSEQSLGFWWDADGTVQVLLSPTPAG